MPIVKPKEEAICPVYLCVSINLTGGWAHCRFSVWEGLGTAGGDCKVPSLTSEEGKEGGDGPCVGWELWLSCPIACGLSFV